EAKWQEATRRAGVTVFDQAYLCAVCSMSVLAGRTEYEDIHEACAVAPLADIIVQIEADERLLGPRLAARIGQQSAVERLFELSPAISMKQVDVARVITVVMTERDQALLRINGNELSTPQQNAIQIADEIAARLLGSKTCAA